MLLAFWLRNVGVHFLNTPIFKSALKCSEAEMFSAFWRRTVLGVTAARAYSTPQLPKVLWGWGAFTIFTYFYIEKCFAPRARFFNILTAKVDDFGLDFFWPSNLLRATTASFFWSLIRPHGSAPATLASLYFRPSTATKHRKNTVFRDLSIIYLFDPFCAPLLLHLSISRKMTSRLLQSWLIHYFWTEHKGENDG